jgi:CheY-like chemotaxis protein
MAERILVVEDENDIRAEIAELLREAGFEVAEAADGNEALQKLRAGPRPCLILLDLMLPGVDGWAFRAEQMKDPVLAKIPVVVLSGVRDLANESRTLAAAAFLPKPFEAEQLLTMVQSYC